MTEGMLELLQGLRQGAAEHPDLRAAPAPAKPPCSTSLSSFIPEDERIVTIEDAAELQLQQTHVARMETRPPNVEGAGAIQHPPAGHQRPPYASRPHHRGRGPRRRGAGHVAGHEHRSRRLADHAPRQYSARRRRPPGGDGRHGQRQHGHPLHPPADRFGGRPVRADQRASATAPAASPHITEVRRHGRRHHHPAGYLPVRKDRRDREAAGSRAASAPPAFAPSSTRSSRPPE